MKRLLHTSYILAGIFLLAGGSSSYAQNHPSLFICKDDGRLIKKQLASLPVLQTSYEESRAVADRALTEKSDVPIPKDPAGGYTHDRHKANYAAMHQAALVYAISGEDKYARFVETMLLEYAKLNPGLSKHPQARGSSPGRLFHQALNDANWLLYSSIAYDGIYNSVSPENRKKIEEGAFRPLTNYLTRDLESWFNLLHNHGVWACAAVGMAGMAMGDDELVQQALYGTKKDGRSGFIAQLNHLFSPDGYYTEGPYYARYALLPFYLFANAIHNTRPALKIFEHRNQVLNRALMAALQQTNTNGVFYPVNDAIKDKTFNSSELVVAVNIAFDVYGSHEGLIAVSSRQGRVILNRSGVKMASALKNQKNPLPGFPYTSVEYTDGAKGNEGGITILRARNDNRLTSLFFKYAAHGLSHGHYDRLNFMLFHNGHEILQDYGAARFLNVEQKDGGRYLKENKSFAMQTIAHNTVAVDETSQFGGDEDKASAHHPEKFYSDLEGEQQAVSAREIHAYPNLAQQRTMILVQDQHQREPVIIDLFRLTSPTLRQYDLPFWYNGQLIATSFTYTPFTNTLQPLGSSNGYQHIWKEAVGTSKDGIGRITFLNGTSFYSISTLADTATEFILGRSGAGDPNFNLRRETAFIVRKKAARELFVSVIEPHGNFNSQSEVSTDSHPSVTSISVLKNDEQYSAVQIGFRHQKQWIVLVANSNGSGTATHELLLDGKVYRWTGAYTVTDK